MSKAKLLEDLGINLGGSTTGTKKVTCPVCLNRKGTTRDKDLFVNIDKGIYKCYSAKCNFEGAVRDDTYKRPEFKTGQLVYPSLIDKFFSDRGISSKTVRDKKITFDDHNIIFNYFEDGRIVNYKKRGLREKTFTQFPDAKKILYNIDSCKDKEDVIIVEGEMDVLALVEAGLEQHYGIVSIDQGAGSEGQKLDGKLICMNNSFPYLKHVKRFILAGDNDGPGIWTFKEIARRIGEWRCLRVDFGSAKDSNEKWVEFKNNYAIDIARDSMINLFKKAEPYPLEGIRTLDSDLQNEMIKEYREGRKLGTPISDGQLETIWSALYGDITLFHGYPSSGKSTYVRNVAVLAAIQHGAKFGCFCPEDFPVNYFFEDLCHIYMGKSTDQRAKVRATEAEYISAMNFIKYHFFVVEAYSNTGGKITMPTNEWINGKLDLLKFQYGINGYIKDPINAIFKPTNIRDDQFWEQEINSEKVYASRWQYAFYVAHPKQKQANKDGSMPTPTPFDLAGGAMFNNKFDNIIVVDRPDRHDDPKSPRVIVRTQKVRKKKLVGKEDTIEYIFDISRNRYGVTDETGFKVIESNYFKPIDNIVQGEFSFTEDLPF